jgi:hypothetical protein
MPQDVSQNPEFDIKPFDEDWGYGKFTVNRRAGLYTEPDLIDSDVVRLIANSMAVARGVHRAHRVYQRFCITGPHLLKMALGK